MFFKKGTDPLLLNLSLYETGGFPPLYLGSLGCAVAPPCPFTAPLARKNRNR